LTAAPLTAAPLAAAPVTSAPFAAPLTAAPVAAVPEATAPEAAAPMTPAPKSASPKRPPAGGSQPRFRKKANVAKARLEPAGYKLVLYCKASDLHPPAHLHRYVPPPLNADFFSWTVQEPSFSRAVKHAQWRDHALPALLNGAFTSPNEALKRLRIATGRPPLANGAGEMVMEWLFLDPDCTTNLKQAQEGRRQLVAVQFSLEQDMAALGSLPTQAVGRPSI
jgi:hypothetical protein